jgi:hypothetical protein
MVFPNEYDGRADQHTSYPIELFDELLDCSWFSAIQHATRPSAFGDAIRGGKVEISHFEMLGEHYGSFQREGTRAPWFSMNIFLLRAIGGTTKGASRK